MLLAVPISHTGIQYMDFDKIFSVSLDVSNIYFAHFFVGVEFPLCQAVSLS